MSNHWRASPRIGGAHTSPQVHLVPIPLLLMCLWKCSGSSPMPGEGPPWGSTSTLPAGSSDCLTVYRNTSFLRPGSRTHVPHAHSGHPWGTSPYVVTYSSRARPSKANYRAPFPDYSDHNSEGCTPVASTTWTDAAYDFNPCPYVPDADFWPDILSDIYQYHPY